MYNVHLSLIFSSEKIEPIGFEFGNTLLADYQGILESNKLSLNDLTTTDIQTRWEQPKAGFLFLIGQIFYSIVQSILYLV